MVSVGSRALVAVLVAAATLISVAGVAAAHTGLEASTPIDGGIVDGPVATIELVFNKPVEPLDGGYTILDSEANPVALAGVAQPSPEVVVVSPVEPLVDGEFGLIWAVRAEDGHPVEGDLAFTAEPAAVTADEETPVTTRPAQDTEPTVRAEPESTALSTALDEAEPARGSADILSWAGRALMYASVLLAVGGLMYLVFVHHGSAAESRRIVFWIRRAAIVVIAATLLEAVAQIAVLHDGAYWSLTTAKNYDHTLGGQYGFGLLLRAGGAMTVLAGLRMSLEETGVGGPGVGGPGVGGADAASPERPATADPFENLEFAQLLAGDRAGHAVLDDVAERDQSAPDPSTSLATEQTVDHSDVWRVSMADSRVAAAGALGIVISFLFIGHTTSEGPRLITALADATHVAAGAAWAGGAAALALTLWNRHRADEPLSAALLVSRFSSVATVGLVAVAIAGVALSIIVLPNLSALWSTSFGQLLLAKTAVVGAVAAAGAYNHHIVAPLLASGTRCQEASQRLLHVVTFEVIGFAATVGLTAALVASSAT